MQGEKWEGGRETAAPARGLSHSEGRRGRATLARSRSLSLTKVSDNLAAVLLFKSGMAPHP